MAEKLTTLERANLAEVGAGIRIYSPSRVSLDRYGPLAARGFVEIFDVGDEQETILHVVPTPTGRAALTNEKA